jgi:hypothetical protein
MRYRNDYSFFLVGLILILHLPLNVFCSQLETLELLSFNPLHIGDRWQYHRVNVCVDDYITVSIVGDTVLWNNQHYYIKEMTKWPGSKYFIRIDTLSLKMLIYHKYDSTEGTLFNYVIPDTGKHCYTDTVTYRTYCEWFYPNQEVGDIPFYADEIGNSISTPWEYNVYCYSKGIGYSYYEWFFRHTGGYETLVAAEIQGVVYGNFVEIESQQTNEMDFYLYQNYPNPFNPITTITYELPKASHVKICIYNLAGQLVQELLNEVKPAGYHTIQWDATNQSSGVYFYQISADEFRDIKKCVLLK